MINKISAFITTVVCFLVLVALFHYGVLTSVDAVMDGVVLVLVYKSLLHDLDIKDLGNRK